MIKLYLVLMGFVSAFAITPLIPIPMLVSLIILVGLFAKIVVSKKLILPFSSNTIFIYATLFLVYMVGLFFIEGDTRTGFNHAFAYIGVIVMFHLVISLGLANTKIEESDIFKYVNYGVILVSLFIIVEFVSKNFLSLDFDSFIYRSAVKEYTPIYNFGGSFLYRARGVMEESGPAAMYLLMFIPFIFYYYTKFMPSRSKRSFYSLITLSAAAVTFSAIGLVEAFVSLAICYLVYLLFDKRIRVSGVRFKITSIIGFHFIAAISLFVISQLKPAQLQFFENLIKKITFSEEAGSSQSRLDRWNLAIELFQQKPFLGWGPGYTSSVIGTGSTSLYLETLVSYGIIGLILLSLVLFYYLKVILSFDGLIRYVFLFSFSIAIIHYFVISAIYFPWMWSLFAIVEVVRFKQKATPQTIHQQH